MTPSTLIHTSRRQEALINSEPEADQEIRASWRRLLRSMEKAATSRRFAQRICTVVYVSLSLFISSSTWFLTAQAGTIIYSHDAAGRLTGASYSDGRFIGYSYDRAGNLTSRQFSLIASGDSDGDGIDDDWELAYFQTLTRDGTGDFDGDGSADRDEFFAGTEPDNPDSLFAVLPEPMVADDGVTVQWLSVPGKTYRLQSRNSVDDLDWTDIPGDVFATGKISTKQDTTPPNGPTRFYRVRLILP